MALTWTCDKCEQPNFMTTMYCSRCGAKRPDRYGYLTRFEHNSECQQKKG